MAQSAIEASKKETRALERAVLGLRNRILQLMLAGVEASPTDVANLIGTDTTLSRLVLKEAQKRWESGEREEMHLERAVQLLGFRRVRRLLNGQVANS